MTNALALRYWRNARRLHSPNVPIAYKIDVAQELSIMAETTPELYRHIVRDLQIGERRHA